MAERYIGLMSGTSMDGIDAALCEFEGTRFTCVRRTHHLPYTPGLRQSLLRVQRELPALDLAELSSLDNAVGESFAVAAQQLLDVAGLAPGAITALGSHGQTVFHRPRDFGATLQLGNPSLIAARTRVATVADFRRADVALGGHGAPLVPGFHQAVFGTPDEPRSVLNLGGIANVTWLPGADVDTVRGFDTGPANALMDEWIEQHLGHSIDADGAFAAGGQLCGPLLDALLADPYFDAQPPKSTGRGEFNLGWLRRRYPAWAQLAAADVQRTLCELTARSVSLAIERHCAPARRVLVCGGGLRNGFLMGRLRALLAPRAVESTAEYGLDPQAVEAAAFAWLAMRTMQALPGSLPAVTGAARAAVLGGIFRA